MAQRRFRGTKHNPWGPDVRARIQTSMLLRRLNKHVLGELELSPTQVRSAEILLRKSLPDLSSIEHVGADGSPLAIEIVRWAPLPAAEPVLELSAEPVQHDCDTKQIT